MVLAPIKKRADSFLEQSSAKKADQIFPTTQGCEEAKIGRNSREKEPRTEHLRQGRKSASSRASKFYTNLKCESSVIFSRGYGMIL